MDREAEALRGRTWVTRSAAETEALGAGRRRALTGGAVLALFGRVGHGQDCLCAGAGGGRGLEAEVPCPTFALVHEYGGQPPLVHFDMYRVTGWDDLYSTGFFDYIDAGCILAVEWSENVEGALPEEALRFRFARREDGAREIACE